jgi:hypothetical protein
LSGSALALAFIIPVLAIAGFGVWIGVVYYAHAHSSQDSTAAPLKHGVKGGAFRGGGRQVMPRRDAVPPEALDYENDGRS